MSVRNRRCDRVFRRRLSAALISCRSTGQAGSSDGGGLRQKPLLARTPRLRARLNRMCRTGSSRRTRSPRSNHCWRWSDEPWVQVSGSTVMPACSWMRSSPTASAAARPSSMSPGSRSPAGLLLTECAHTPARQSACSSRLHRPLVCLRLRAGRLLALAHLVADARQVLHVVADLVGDHVGLGEVAGGAEPVAQLVGRSRGRCTPRRRPGNRRAPLPRSRDRSRCSPGP